MTGQCFRAWWLPGFVLLVAVMVALVTLRTSAQESYSYATGQNIVPVYEGWEQNPDGSFNLVFGYFNRNWEEAIDIPPGPNNNIDPGGPDWEQPTRFFPRRSRFVFRIRVPANFGEQELVWTLTSNGKTERAYATLIPEYLIDNLIIMANNGMGTALDQTLQGNEAPTLQVEGGAARTARVGQPVTLTAFVSDDDVPSPRGLPASSPGRPGTITAIGSRGLRVSWFVYRGSGRVTFDPPQTKVWADTREGANSPWAPGWSPPPVPEDGRWVVRATFANPGTYVLQCLAHDGGLMTSANVTFVVDH